MEGNLQFQLTRHASLALAQDYGTPLLVLSLTEIERNYQRLRRYLPRVRIHYAIKANPDRHILDRMIALGSSFDVASDGEIQLLHDLGVEGSRMIYANPVKPLRGLKACRETGVGSMTFDSAAEIEKIASVLPGATVLVRLCIDNRSAHIDLNRKFGCRPEQAVELLLQAKSAGLDAAGIAFHVGSQTTQSDPYLRALDTARGLFDEAAARGLPLRILDIGGGLPIPEHHVSFNLKALLQQINARLDEDFPDTEIWAEPGRYICGTAVNLLTSVIGVTERNGSPWYFLDEGLYGTFSGILFDQWDFKLRTFKTGPRMPATFAGPSCDSLDILFRDRLTEPLERGDVLLVPDCGAYTSASATTFNGFGRAPYLVWEEVADRYNEKQRKKE
ncbi:MAG: Lysine/ornithine decarboxylase [Succiniclasticum sp.]|jgi:ornithine decarboxylase